MGYPALGATGLVSSPDYPTGVPASSSPNILSSVGGIISNPVGGALSLIGSIFGGGPNTARIATYTRMLPIWYNLAISTGDVNAARALIYYAQGGTPYPENMRPPSSAYLMQMQTTAPKVLAAAQTAGAWPKGAQDVNTDDVPRNPNPSLVGSSSSGIGGALSALTGGNSTVLLGLGLAAAFFLSKKR